LALDWRLSKSTDLADWPKYLLIKKAIVTFLDCALRKKDMNLNGWLLRLGFNEREAALRFNWRASARRHIGILLFWD
jgi:hypothetical protein